MKHVSSLTIIFLVATITYSFGWLNAMWYTQSQQENKKSIDKKDIPKKQLSILETIKKDKTLDVVLLNSLSTYYIGINEEKGFEYDMLKAYAKHLGAELNITVAQTTKEALDLSKTIHPHITSAGLAKTIKSEKKYNFGPSYFEVQEQVICNRRMLDKKILPKEMKDLAGLRMMIGEETSYVETIEALQSQNIEINATTTTLFSTEEIVAKVAANEVDCTIVNSNIYSINLKYFPEIVMAFTISERQPLAWLIDKNATDLKADMYRWFNHFNQSGKCDELQDHYYGNLLFFDYYNIKMFYKRIKTRLPKYKKYFQKASRYYGIPWRLLAAISYQESHWNPRAKSFTGVRGMMMLTQKTAKLLGVKDRLNPKQSIVGGTRHIKQMIKFVPKNIKGENRLKFALAAYNIGLGHIYDAQKLARKLNLDDKSWNDLKKVLPLLAYKKHNRSLRYGYARGSEAVKYVESIYNYRNILQNLTKMN